MRKRNLILLSIIFILVCVLVSLLIYGFQLQRQRASEIQATEEDRASLPADASQEEDPGQDTTVNISPTITPASTDTPDSTVTQAPTESPKTSLILGFAGDVCLDEFSDPVVKYVQENQGILGLFSEDLAEEMNNADLMMLNNEFAYSTRGTKAPDKSFTFRADPSRVNILKDLGVDIVSLANNHALDYGEDALDDTFSTLDTAGIDYVGAGDDIDRAKSPIYKKVGGKTIAYIAATRVVPVTSWYATDTTPGMVGTYDPAEIVEAIKEAKENSDFVVMFVHWGVERNTTPEEYQRKLAKTYIDAGADVVVGCHPHVMQGFEYYNGKLIAYSLGNYLFNDSTKKSGMLKLYLAPDGSTKAQILPVMNKATRTYILTEAKDRSNYFDYMESLSFDTVIDEDGFITQK